jgi:hypothetical protein
MGKGSVKKIISQYPKLRDKILNISPSNPPTPSNARIVKPVMQILACHARSNVAQSGRAADHRAASMAKHNPPAP